MTEPGARVFLPLNPSITLRASLLIAILTTSTASLFIRFAQAEAVPSKETLAPAVIGGGV